jgi:hypothetical protein
MRKEISRKSIFEVLSSWLASNHPDFIENEKLLISLAQGYVNRYKAIYGVNSDLVAQMVKDKRFLALVQQGQKEIDEGKIHVLRKRGRPKKEEKEEQVFPTLAVKKRGRPFGSKNKRKRGRPKLNKIIKIKRKRGRPKKNRRNK